MINVAVEGESDREVAKAVARAAGVEVNLVRVAGGKTKLDARIPKYNQASVQFPWVVFRDSDAQCPVMLRAHLTANISAWQPGFMLRIAHSMSEAWLLADPDGFSSYFRVPRKKIPCDPESLPHAKRTLLALCAGSLSKTIRREVTEAGGKETGPLFVWRMNDFASKDWNPIRAGTASGSLRRAIAQIRQIHGASGSTP